MTMPADRLSQQVQGQSPCMVRGSEELPLKLKHLGRSMKVANVPTFKTIQNAKIQIQSVLFLQKN